MMQSEPIDFPRYLLSKRSIEARCFNVQVWSALLDHLASPGSQALRILEVGGGVGSMALRFLESSAVTAARYTIVEASAASLAVARHALAPLNKDWSFDFVEADLFDYLGQYDAKGWDLLVGHALLDLLDLETALPRLLASLKPGGAFYFPINYDGLTIFEPEVDAEFESQLFSVYHRSMDQRREAKRPSGNSRTGRHLLSALPATGALIQSAGASDWVVVPKDGGYPADETYFLSCILDTIEAELAEAQDLDQLRLQSWLAVRRSQLARAELILIAHQLDIFGTMPRVE
ncbi:MAG: class I SAM-dependent methyltransferase [Anaerolineales bacterium]